MQLLVTSRERLAIAGEHEYPLGDAHRRRRAGGSSSSGRVRSIPASARRRPCPSCAAGWTSCRWRSSWRPRGRSCSAPEQLLERLSQRLDLLRGGRDADARQQTLRATIEWSHELLDPGERQLFARLAVFVGGCTFEAAETVCDADPERSSRSSTRACSAAVTTRRARPLLDARDDPRVRARTTGGVGRGRELRRVTRPCTSAWRDRLRRALRRRAIAGSGRSTGSPPRSRTSGPRFSGRSKTM